MANSQSSIANGVCRRVRQIDTNNAVYNVAININRNILIPIKTNAEYCHPNGKRSCKCKGKQTAEYVP